MAIIDISGFAAKPDAKAFAPSPPKMETAWANNARLTEQIFDGGFCACFCTKGDSGNLSGAAVCYVIFD